MGNLGNTLLGQSAEVTGRSLIEIQELEKWQKHFCSIANIFVCCVDGNGTALTEFGGNAEDKDQLRKIIDNEQFHSMLQRVSESTLEEQAIETTAYPNLRLAVISAKADGKPVLNWLVCGVLSDVVDTEDYEKELLQGFHSTVGEKQFRAAIDALHDITCSLMRYKEAETEAEIRIQNSRKSELEMEERVKRAEALLEVTQLLDSKLSIERIMGKLLNIVGNFLQISVGVVYQVPQEGQKITVLSSWMRAGITWNPEQKYDQEYASFFQAKRTLILSAGSMPKAMPKAAEKKALEQMGLTAAVIIPVTINGAIERYVCFGQISREHVWKLEETKFIKDSVKILQSILIKKMG